MASREQLNALRQQAVKRHKAATRKVSRLKASGVSISGTGHDPRVDLAKVKTMNTREATRYLQRLDAFVSRETQFVAGARGKVLSGNLWKRKEQLENQLNKEKAQHLAQIADINIPGAGMTVAERVAAMIPKHPTMGMPAAYQPHLPVKSGQQSFTSDKALKEAIKDLEGKVGGKYFDKTFKSQYTAAKKMVKDIANKDLSKKFKTLTPEEFSFIWNYTNFAEVTALDYTTRKSMLHDRRERAWYDQTIDTNMSQAMDRIDDVKTLKLGSRLRDNHKR